MGLFTGAICARIADTVFRIKMISVGDLEPLIIFGIDMQWSLGMGQASLWQYPKLWHKKLNTRVICPQI